LVIRNRIPPTVSVGMARKSSRAESGTIKTWGEVGSSQPKQWPPPLLQEPSSHLLQTPNNTWVWALIPTTSNIFQGIRIWSKLFQMCLQRSPEHTSCPTEIVQAPPPTSSLTLWEKRTLGSTPRDSLVPNSLHDNLKLVSESVP
jgi:hypothetical protein